MPRRLLPAAPAPQSAPSPARLFLLLLLLLSTPLSQLDLTTARRSTLVSLPYAYSLERVIRPDARLIGGIPRTGHVSGTCYMYSTGNPSSSGSYSGLLP